MKKLVLMLMLAVLVTAAQAELIVDFTPNATVYKGARGADISTLTGDMWNFSDTTALVGPGGGQNDTIYGSLNVTWSAEQDYSPPVRHINWGAGGFQVQNNPPVKATNGITGVYVWIKDDFLGSPQRVGFGAGSSISFDFGWVTNINQDYRIVVKQGGDYYISQWYTKGKDNITMDPSTTNWALLNTADTTWGSFAPLKLSDVEAVGLYYTVALDNNQAATVLEDFKVDAQSPLEPSPEDGGVVITDGATGTVTLGWENYIDPNHTGATVKAYVWFGTDPNKAEPALYSKVIDGQIVTPDTHSESGSINIDAGTTYYWQVDFDNDSNDIIEGPVFEFLAVNNAKPEITISNNVMAWLDEQTGKAVITMDATVVDDTPGYTIEWTLDPAGDANVAIDSTTIEKPTLTIDATGVWNATVTVEDGYWTESAQCEITVVENHCEAARLITGYQGDPVGDITGDCATDIEDLAILAQTWLDDTRLSEKLYF